MPCASCDRNEFTYTLSSILSRSMFMEPFMNDDIAELRSIDVSFTCTG